jgi:hypothetical protein
MVGRSAWFGWGLPSPLFFIKHFSAGFKIVLKIVVIPEIIRKIGFSFGIKRDSSLATKIKI